MSGPYVKTSADAHRQGHGQSVAVTGDPILLARCSHGHQQQIRRGTLDLLQYGRFFIVIEIPVVNARDLQSGMPSL
jgi:hypothetical protein